MQMLRNNTQYARGICQWIYNVCGSYLTYSQSDINYNVGIGNIRNLSSVSLNITPLWIFFIPYLNGMFIGV